MNSEHPAMKRRDNMKMNRNIGILMSMVLLVSLMACRTADNVSSAPTAPEEEISVSLEPDQPETPPVVVIEKSALSDGDKAWIKQNLNDFAFRSAPKVLTAEPESDSPNILYSPAGLYLALSMLGECADGDSEAEVLGFLQPVEQGIQSDMSKALMGNMIFQNENGRQVVENSIWLAEDCEIVPDVQALLEERYSADIMELDLSNPQAMDEWASGYMEGTLPERRDLGQDAVMVITNLISFKDNWIVPFNKDNTVTEDFTLPNGEIQKADYMCAYSEGGFIQMGTFAAASYPFKNGSRIHFILPEEGVTPEELLADSGTLSTAIDYSAGNQALVMPGCVSYKIPKTSFTSSMELTDAMKTLGMEAVFAGGLPAIVAPPDTVYMDEDGEEIADGGHPFVSGVFQDCYFEINEKGALAEARTEIVIAAESEAEEVEELPPLLELHLTRPFLFIITSPEGYVTFVGVVNNPAAE